MNVKDFFIKVQAAWKKLTNDRDIERIFRISYDILVNIVIFLVISGSLVVIFAGGVGAGYFASLVKDEPIREYEEMKKDIYNYEETSKLYFADNIYIGDIRADLHREEISLDEVSDLVKQAVIATEDELFYEHNGVVPKAIVRAIIQDVTNAERKTGGSTLTQQLIKNQILTNEVSFERKAKEILLAMRLENFFDKDEILEAYLNIVPYGREASGRNIAGIQTAAQGIFGVDASELTLPQAAYLAGLPQNPFTYTPFTSNGELKDEEGLDPGINRMKTVLGRMHHIGIIDEKEYNEAINHDIVSDFTEKSISPIDEYPAIIFELENRAKDILKEQLAIDDGYSIEEVEEDETLNEQYAILADRALRRNGYHIHSTIDKEMYDAMQEVVANYQHFGPDRTFVPTGGSEKVTEQVEVGAEIIENSTGRILSFVPGRDYRVGSNEVNYATGYGAAGRQPGSTFKPVAVYGPAMDLGYIQPGSVIADIPGHSGYSPHNYGRGFYGLVSAREALTFSYNVSTAEIYKKILHEDPAEKYLKKMGITLTKDEQFAPSIALGTNNVTVEQNTAAFATFSNGGSYVEPYMIEKITDNNGNIIYEHKSEPVEVFSPQTAYLTIDMMRDVVRSGTGTYAMSRLKHGGVDWAGKTGTSNDYHDAWFVATNPNVTMGIWFGYNTPSSIYCSQCSLSYSQRTQNLWAQLVNVAADINKDLVAPQERHKQPEGIVSRSYCATSGLIPSKLCSDAGLVRSDIYNSKFVPTKEDNSLIGGDMALVEIDGEQIVAGPDTPAEFTLDKTGGISFNPDFLKEMGYDRLGDLSVLIPRKNRERWEKIIIGGSPVVASEIKAQSSGPPSAPGSIKASETNVSWAHKKGELIVGYRIYFAESEGGNYTLIGHTTSPSYRLPNREGIYHIRAVNYFGMESQPSANIIIEGKEEEPEDVEDQKPNDDPPNKKKPNDEKPKDNEPKKPTKPNDSDEPEDEETDEE